MYACVLYNILIHIAIYHISKSWLSCIKTLFRACSSHFYFGFAWRWTLTVWMFSCLTCGNSRTNYGMCEFKHAQSILKLNLRENLKRRLLIFTTIYSLGTTKEHSKTYNLRYDTLGLLQVLWLCVKPYRKLIIETKVVVSLCCKTFDICT